MIRRLAPLALLALAACTYSTPSTSWTLAEGDVITTSFQIGITRDDEGAEDSTIYTDSIDACTATVVPSDIVRFVRADTGKWIVWAEKPGRATITLEGCDANKTGWSDPQVTIDITVTAR